MNPKGFDTGPEDGDFGPRTRTAVILAQCYGLPSTNQEGVVSALLLGSSMAD
jgi:peptidoglycan hydrolase-like protein with peptidoglycan-binding domain